jgi:SAM-dependent methyltransferase
MILSDGSLLWRALNRLYYVMTGIRIEDLRRSRAELAGTLSALSNFNMQRKPIEVVELEKIFRDCSDEKDCQELATLLAQHGSDKSTKHNYHIVYATLLKEMRNSSLSIIEIGLGTTNQEIPSHMETDGVPGASLRAFRDWGKNFMVYGADIDAEILFSEDRISTYFVDQTDPRSLRELAARFPAESVDLIIDDGWHHPWANLNTLNALWDLLKPKSFFVVEDIFDDYVYIWQVALAVMPERYHCQLIRAKSEIMCVIQKL